jgi:hypothetical protein
MIIEVYREKALYTELVLSFPPNNSIVFADANKPRLVCMLGNRAPCQGNREEGSDVLGLYGSTQTNNPFDNREINKTVH